MPSTSRPAARRLILAAAFVTMVTFAARPALPVTPGVDIAAPKVAISNISTTALAFLPARLVVEQDDFVRWNWTVGSHTTTSGAPCVASGLWNTPLSSTSTSFTRAFIDDPGTYPYFCNPHCTFGMTGQVVVTTDVEVQVNASGADVKLDWTGGGGLYRIFRSTSPLFTSGTTTVLTGGTGLQATTFLDQTGGTPPVGAVNYYLVMNHF